MPHKVGAAEGDRFTYMQFYCAVFLLQDDDHDHCFVRPKEFNREQWDVFCHDPAGRTKPAAESLGEEMIVAARRGAINSGVS